MIKTLKARPRSDNSVSEKRGSTVGVGRYVYLSLLGLLGVGAVNFLWGDLLILRADGLVLRDRSVIAASYLAEVEDVSVREGEKVKEGDVLLRLKSMEILQKIADLSSKHADLAQRAADFHTRANVAEKLTPLAQRREVESRQALAEYEELGGDGFVTAARREGALRAHFDAREARVQFAAESQTLAREIPTVEDAQASAASALEKLASLYANGEIRAPKGGAIGASVPSAGAVYLPGDPMLTIYSGEAYSLVYLPTRYLLPVREGMRVAVSNGRQRAQGVIDEILPVSDALPAEFQNTFRPQERSQLARIRFEGAAPFPVGEKIKVSINYFAPRQRALARIAAAEASN